MYTCKFCNKQVDGKQFWFDTYVPASEHSKHFIDRYAICKDCLIKKGYDPDLDTKPRTGPDERTGASR